MEQNWTFVVDSVLILRGFGALVWGFVYAAGLTFTKTGRYLANQLTWFSVVIGVGGCLMLSWPAGWYTVAGVFALAAVGIILRSLILDSRGHRPDDTIFRSHKTKNGIDDATAHIMTIWQLAIKGAQHAPPNWAATFNMILTNSEMARSHLVAARRGDEFNPRTRP